MKNVTDFNKPSFTFRIDVWITEILFDSILVLISSYILIALLYFQINVEKSTPVKFFQLNLEKKYGVLSKLMCILIAIFSVLLQLDSVAQLVADGNTFVYSGSTQQTHVHEVACKVLSHVAGATLFPGSFMVYLFLWLRQSIFYVHPCLKCLFNKCLQITSIAVLIFCCLSFLSFFVIYLIYIRYELNEDGVCHFELNTGDDMSSGEIIIFSWTILSVAMQITLLGLFVYPLLKRTAWQNNQQDQQNFHLIRKVKKAVFLASMCLVTDLLAVGTLTLVQQENTNNATFMYNVNLVINHLATIVCFDHWKKLLWPWKIKCCKIFSTPIKDIDSVPVSSFQPHNMNTTSIEIASASAASAI